MTKPAHLIAQSVLVRMLYDPRFAEAVRHAPREVVPELPPSLADELGRIDPRALRRDRHRAERTLGQLSVELPASTTLAIAEGGTMATLLDFFHSATLHEALRDDTSLVLALATYLQLALAEGRLRSPHLSAVLAVEFASARARRSGDDPQTSHLEIAESSRYRRARGVEVVQVRDGTLATLQAVEQHRFRLGLLPVWAQANDPPTLALPPLGSGRSWIAAISLRGQVSLVEIEPALAAVLSSLPTGPRTRQAIVAEAVQRLGGDRGAIEAAFDSLVADELVLMSS